MTTKRRGKRTLPAALVAAAAVGMVAGCTPGHGKYTQDHKDQAIARMNTMKAATSWDMAHQQFQSGDLKKALKTVDESIAYDPAVPKSHVLRGRILIEMDRMSTALASFDQAVELVEEQNAEAAKTRPSDAVGPARPDLVDEHAAAYYYKGIVLERFAEYDRAGAAYLEAATIDDADPQYRLAAAEMMIQQGDVDEAERLLRDGMATFEHNAGFRQTLGHIAMMRGDVDVACRLFGEACLLAPADAQLMEDLARAEIEAERYADAEYTLRRLIAMDAKLDRRDLKYLHARCLIELDRPVEARTTLLGLAEDAHGSKDVRVWIELGRVALILNEDRRLRECAQRVTALDPARSDGHLMMAMWLHRTDRTEAGIETLRRAMRLSDDPVSLAVMQGVLYQEMGDHSKARASALLAQRIDPADARANALLERINRSSAVVTGVPSTD